MSIFEITRLIPKLKPMRSLNLFNEVNDKYITNSLNGINIGSGSLTDLDRSKIEEFINFANQRTKMYRLIECLEEDTTLEEDFTKFPKINEIAIKDKSMKDLLSDLSSASESNYDISNKLSNSHDQGKGKDKQLNYSKFDDGKSIFSMKNGKLTEGHGEAREISTYSNWTAGNIDPEDLERHKKLIERQHYEGPFWEGKRKPKSIEEEQPIYIPETDDENPISQSESNEEGIRNFKNIHSN